MELPQGKHLIRFFVGTWLVGQLEQALVLHGAGQIESQDDCEDTTCTAGALKVWSDEFRDIVVVEQIQ